jgi:RimJ/RimL family protein N-acetyltransferase
VSEVAPLARPLPRLVVGERLRLDVWSADMVDEVLALVVRSQPTLAEFLPWATTMPSREEEAAAQATSEEAWREGRMAGWMLIEDSVIRGMVGLHRRGGPDELEIGYWLDDTATGRGLMTEACAMATDVAFSVDGIDVVEILHDMANPRSEGVPRRLGYRRVAAFTATPTARSESGIKVRWRVRRDEWRALARPTSVVSMQ